jgi:hypothetical protein
MKVVYSVIPVMDLLLAVERHASFAFVAGKMTYAAMPSVQFLQCSVTIHHLSRLHLQRGKSIASEAHIATLNSKIPPPSWPFCCIFNWNKRTLI